MSTAIDQLTATTVFNHARYVVPIYQRNYAWGPAEIEQLLADVRGFCATTTQTYFLGNLIVDRTAIEDQTVTYTVIDGQQRLTTLLLLVGYLQSILGPTEKSGRPIRTDCLSFESRDRSNRLLTDILTRSSVLDQFATNSLVAGYQIIKHYFETQRAVAQQSLTEFASQFYDKLQRVQLLRIQVPANIDLNHYFEIMNTRGEQLELHELAKARILAQLSDPQSQVVANVIWEACSRMDTYVQMNVSRTVRTAWFGTTWDDFQAMNFDELVAGFNATTEEADSNNQKLTQKVPQRQSLAELLRTPVAMVEEPQPVGDSEASERFSSIMSFSNFLLQVNAAKQVSEQDDESLNDRHLTTILKPTWANESAAKQFLFNLLVARFKFDRFILKREQRPDMENNGSWSLKRLQRERKGSQYTNTFVDNGADQNRQLRVLEACLRITYTAPRTMHWVTTVLRLPLTATAADIIDQLEADCVAKLGETYQNYTGFGVPRLLFTFLDYTLWCRDRPTWTVGFRTSIEHFSPQHPADNVAPWEDRDLNSLGNLALISVAANSRFSNLDPKSKIETYGDVVKQSPKLQRMVEKMATDPVGWTPKKAARHREEMLAILAEKIRTVQKTSDRNHK